MADNHDMISQAMGILGGSKKKDAPEAPRQPLLPRALREAAPAPAPVPVRVPAPVSRLSKAERVVVKELARYAALHAALIEMRHESDNGANPMLIEQKLEEVLRNAKVVIK
jgi:hypothetical protein